MSEVKAKMLKIVEYQPEDASFSEILKELAFESWSIAVWRMRGRGGSYPMRR